MDDNVNYPELVGQAQLGNQESMNRLAELVEGRLFAYIYRLTLNYDLAQDLLQETLLGMIKSLKELKDADRFWFWLFRSALGKVQHHFRERRQRRIVQMSAIEKEHLLRRISKEHDDGLNYLVRKELSDAIFEATGRLKLMHRSVLALRCFEQMPYSEIANLMGCKELHARVLFFRAKRLLKRQLSRRGFGKELLVVALGLLGLMTAPTKAASATSTVTAASLGVGFVAAAIGTLYTNVGIAVATAIGAITLAVATKGVMWLVTLLFVVSLCFVLVSLVGLYTR